MLTEGGANIFFFNRTGKDWRKRKYEMTTRVGHVTEEGGSSGSNEDLCCVIITHKL